MTVTGTQLRAQSATHNISRWIIRDCSICGYPLGWYFGDGGIVMFDAGCDCTSYGPAPMRPADWQEVATHFNMQDRPDVIERYRAFWHLSAEDV